MKTFCTMGDKELLEVKFNFRLHGDYPQLNFNLIMISRENKIRL
jgi:hypothetical protein